MWIHYPERIQESVEELLALKFHHRGKRTFSAGSNGKRVATVIARWILWRRRS